MAEKKPLCFCGNCFTSPLYRLSDWATSQCWILREVLSIARELVRKSFWVPIHWQLDIIYQDSTIRGCGLQKRWRAELLPPHCQRCCHLSPAMTDGQVGTHEKKGQESFSSPCPFGRHSRTLCPLGVWAWSGLIRTGISSPCHLARIMIYLAPQTVWPLF